MCQLNYSGFLKQPCAKVVFFHISLQIYLYLSCTLLLFYFLFNLLNKRFFFYALLCGLLLLEFLFRVIHTYTIVSQDMEKQKLCQQYSGQSHPYNFFLFFFLLYCFCLFLSMKHFFIKGCFRLVMFAQVIPRTFSNLIHLFHKTKKIAQRSQVYLIHCVRQNDLLLVILYAIERNV